MRGNFKLQIDDNLADGTTLSSVCTLGYEFKKCLLKYFELLKIKKILKIQAEHLIFQNVFLVFSFHWHLQSCVFNSSVIKVCFFLSLLQYGGLTQKIVFDKMLFDSKYSNFQALIKICYSFIPESLNRFEQLFIKYKLFKKQTLVL